MMVMSRSAMGDVNSHEDGQRSTEEDIPNSPQRNRRGRHNDLQRLNYTTVENISFNGHHGGRRKQTERSLSLPTISIGSRSVEGKALLGQSVTSAYASQSRYPEETHLARPRFMSVQDAPSNEYWASIPWNMPFSKRGAGGKLDPSEVEYGRSYPYSSLPERNQSTETLPHQMLESNQFEPARNTPYDQISENRDEENDVFYKSIKTDDNAVFPIEDLKEQDVFEVLQALGADTDDDPFESPLSSLPNEGIACPADQSLTTEAELRDLHVNDNELRSLEKQLDVEGSRMQEVANHCEALPASMLLPSEPQSWVPQDGTMLPGLEDGSEMQPEVTFQTPRRAPATPGFPVNNPDSWDILRQLDEDERWTERVQVVTCHDHQEYLVFARQFLEEIIDSLPIGDSPAPLEVSGNFAQPPVDSRKTELQEGAKPDSSRQLQREEEQKENLPPVVSDETTNMEEAIPKTGKSIYDMSEEDMKNMNPFNTGSGLQNSPPTNNKSDVPTINYDDKADPFQTTSKVQSSPKNTKRSPPKNAVQKPSPEFNFDESLDPFAPKHTMQNSPPSSPKHETNNASTEFPLDDYTNPFKTKTQMQNSLPLLPKNATHNSSEMMNFDEIEDPFATTGKLPTCNSLKNASPEPETEINFDEIQDPFASKKAMQNSPDASPKSATRKARSTTKNRTPPKASKKSPSPKSSPSGSSTTKITDSTAPDTDGLDNAPGQKPTLEVTPIPRGDDVEGRTAKTDQNYEQFLAGEEFVLAPEEADDFPRGTIGNQLGDEEFRPAEEGLKRDISFEEMEFRLAEEVFASADPAAFDVDFLEKAGSSKTFQESALARQSLYVKFDPLVDAPADRAAKCLLAIAPEPVIQEDEGDLLQMQTPPSSVNTRQSAKVRERAMMSAACKAEAEGQGGMSEGVDSLLAFSPQRRDGSQGVDDIDGNEPSLPAPPSMATDDESMVQPLLHSQADLDAAVREAIKTEQKRSSKEVGQYKKKLEDRDKLIASQKQKQQEVEKSTENLSALVTQYEKAMQQMMGDINKAKDSSQESVAGIQKEKEQALEDLASVENAFSDLHRRYEKLKQTVESYKKNEEVLKKCVSDYQAKLKKQEQRYQTLKSHAEEKIERANSQIDMVKKSYEGELSALQAAVKRETMKVESMENTIEQKTKENAELSNICDELIAKIADNK